MLDLIKTRLNQDQGGSLGMEVSRTDRNGLQAMSTWKNGYFYTALEIPFCYYPHILERYRWRARQLSFSERRLFPCFEPMTSQSQWNNLILDQASHFNLLLQYIKIQLYLHLMIRTLSPFFHQMPKTRKQFCLRYGFLAVIKHLGAA